MYLGDFAEDATVYLMFNTFTSDDPSASSTITNFINTDVHIHKDNGLAQRNNAAGITVSVDFDAITGSHMIAIDTSDNTVAGFWVTGSDYFVRIEGTTVDAATLNVVVGQFSIENRYNPVTDYDGPTKAEMDVAHALLATEAKQDIIDTNVDQIEAAVITNAAGVDIAADIIALKAETALIVADTNELQTDDYPTSIAAVQTTADAIETAVITNAAGVDVAADIIAIKAETADIVADTNELQTDDYPTSIAAIKAETALIVADTNELQTDDTPAAITALDAKIDILDTNVDQIETAVITNAAGADIAADIIAIKAETASILADTDELQTDDYPTSIAAVKAETALIVADTNELQTDDIPAQIAALENLSAAEVNAQVLDVLNVDTFAEPGQENPAATASLATKIGYLYKLMRNKIETTAALISVYNDAGAVVDQKSTIADDGVTFTRGEFGTGP